MLPFFHPPRLDENPCAQALGLHVEGFCPTSVAVGVCHSLTMHTITWTTQKRKHR